MYRMNRDLNTPNTAVSKMKGDRYVTGMMLSVSWALSHITSPKALAGVCKVYKYPHLADEETKAPRKAVTWPRPCSK